MLGPQTNLKFNNTEIILSVFSEHKEMKPEINAYG
jgi:hypothetical protein